MIVHEKDRVWWEETRKPEEIIAEAELEHLRLKEGVKLETLRENNRKQEPAENA